MTVQKPSQPAKKGEAPKVLHFEASPAQVEQGSAVMLRWTLGGGPADKVLLNGQPVQGNSCTRVPAEDPTIYTLVAANAAGFDRREVAVGVNESGDVVSGEFLALSVEDEVTPSVLAEVGDGDFAPNKTFLLPKALGTFKAVLDESRKHSGKAKVLVVGHADSSGSQEHNLALSEERAASVVQFLKHQPSEWMKNWKTKPKGSDKWGEKEDAELLQHVLPRASAKLKEALAGAKKIKDDDTRRKLVEEYMNLAGPALQGEPVTLGCSEWHPKPGVNPASASNRRVDVFMFEAAEIVPSPDLCRKSTVRYEADKGVKTHCRAYDQWLGKTRKLTPAPIPQTPKPARLPKYVFVLSLENRSFDHLFGRSGIKGKDAANPSRTRSVDGVLLPDGSINPECKNTYEGYDYLVPNEDAPDIMVGDPKHEFEHILCQTCGPEACVDLFRAFAATPPTDTYGTNPPPAEFYDAVPPPAGSLPQFVRFNRKKKKTTLDMQRPEPPERPRPNNKGFVHSWVRSFSLNELEGADAYPEKLKIPCPDRALVMRCFDSARQLPILHTLASNFVICDNFFSSLPGPTAPNRFFMMAGESARCDGGPPGIALEGMAGWNTIGHLPLKKGHIFSQLSSVGVRWRIYSDDRAPMSGVLEGCGSSCAVYEAKATHTEDPSLERDIRSASEDNPLPSFLWIEPDYDVGPSLAHTHPMYRKGNSMHPCSDIRKGEQLIADVYNWIKGNKHVWENSALFITWDEHGGFYDHVPSPAAKPPFELDLDEIGQTWGFKFDVLGSRVPCLVISPLTQANVVDNRLYDQCSILKTVIDLHNKGAFTKDGKEPPTALSPWTGRIEAAASMAPLFTQAAADAREVKLPQPRKPVAVQEKKADRSQPPPAQVALSGNTAVFVSVMMNLHKNADHTVDLSKTAASLTTPQALTAYLEKARAAIDSARPSQTGEKTAVT